MKTAAKLKVVKPNFHTSTVTQPMSVVDQVISASHKKNRLAMVMGFGLGGFMPVASCVMKHETIDILKLLGPISVDNAQLWLALVKMTIVLGCLAFSALTIFEWTKIAFRNPVKAIGFVLALDGVMVFSQTPYLSYSALVILILINGVASGCKLALDRKESRK